MGTERPPLSNKKLKERWLMAKFYLLGLSLLLTDECRRLAESVRVMATAADNKFRVCWDRINAVEEDDVVDLSCPEVRTAAASWRHGHRLHPVGSRGVATVQLMCRTPVVSEYLVTHERHKISTRFLLHAIAYFQHANKYANKAEASLKLFQAVSVCCFSFISECNVRRA